MQQRTSASRTGIWRGEPVEFSGRAGRVVEVLVVSEFDVLGERQGIAGEVLEDDGFSTARRPRAP